MEYVRFPLISDRNQTISREYCVLDKKSGTAKRATIIINPEGIIESRMVYPKEVGRNIEEIVRILEAAQFANETKLGVPANWTPGQPGIARDISDAGKV